MPVVSTDEGLETALRFNSVYLEVSAIKNDNIENLFDLIIQKALVNRFRIII